MTMSRRGTRRAPEGRQGYCYNCGKMSFDSRKTARANARRNFPHEQLNAFRCYVDDDVWHYGHLKDGDRD